MQRSGIGMLTERYKHITLDDNDNDNDNLYLEKRHITNHGKK